MRVLQKVIPMMLFSAACSSFAGEQIDKSLLVSDVSSVNIENLRGNITVIGWDKNTISIKGELEDDAEGLLFKQQGSRVKIKVELENHSNNFWGNNAKGSVLTIHMPKNIRVRFEGIASDINFENLHASAEAKTVSGNIKAVNLSERIELISVSGDINSSKLSGKVSLSSVSGNIKDRQSRGRLSLRVVSGEIDAQSTAKEVTIENVSGDINIGLNDIDELTVANVSGDLSATLSLNDGGVVKMSSVSGGLALKLQKNVQASFRLSASAGGQITNKITTQKSNKAKYGPSSKLDFETGSANANVRVNTVNGNISVSN
ncbi:DUF4097 family beta strand repeat-containing protein [Colwellia sp. BRX9-1]|uniref:DUF4097 family beta strand repeat-containing protein n=1 Tax=Colwellia sp. BRX9-1 TaxID=2759830 RepID=UPI0015F450A5|nr:DUF4097 family beta strand repeat-containing protein [Colwellia sp. BRX9-1]MBA6350481.1 DUF4097 family beta strand repeat protein [Colwellia sp. BRX9-1]